MIWGRWVLYDLQMYVFPLVLLPADSSPSFWAAPVLPTRLQGYLCASFSPAHLELPLLGKHSCKPGCKELMGQGVLLA